jgi:hypothetical protein
MMFSPGGVGEQKRKQVIPGFFQWIPAFHSIPGGFPMSWGHTPKAAGKFSWGAEAV